MPSRVPPALRSSAAVAIAAALVSVSVTLSGCGGDSREAGGPAAGSGVPGDGARATGAPSGMSESAWKFCSACHRLPLPDTLPRAQWRRRIEVMFEIARGSQTTIASGFPSLEAVVDWYVERAPEVLPAVDSTVHKGSGGLRLESRGIRLPQLGPFPGTANVRFVRLFGGPGLDLLVTDMRSGAVCALRPYLAQNDVRVLGVVKHPCNTSVVDLDRDGRLDLLVSDLGTPTPSDATNGGVFWFRGGPDETFAVYPLQTGLGRVADAQAADFDGDGDLDIVVAVFGWRRVGEILLLVNRSEGAEAPRFEPFRVDPRPGTIHVPVADLDGDGDVDFVALISQQFEAIVAFLNDGHGRFTPRELFRASHPNWGSTGIELVDLDGDADLDILFTNGDTLDDLVVKPYHGVQWLENRGDLEYVDHRLSDLYGASSAKAADLDGDGDLDIVASAFLPYLRPDDRGADLIESLVWFEQVAPRRFERWSIERTATFHASIDVGDYDADGDIDIVGGNLVMRSRPEDVLEHAAVIWSNLLR